MSIALGGKHHLALLLTVNFSTSQKTLTYAPLLFYCHHSIGTCNSKFCLRRTLHGCCCLTFDGQQLLVLKELEVTRGSVRAVTFAVWERPFLKQITVLISHALGFSINFTILNCNCSKLHKQQTAIYKWGYCYPLLVATIEHAPKCKQSSGVAGNVNRTCFPDTEKLKREFLLDSNWAIYKQIIKIAMLSLARKLYFWE